MQIKVRQLLPFLALSSALTVLAALPAQAQTLKARPGLWIGSASPTLNGQALLNQQTALAGLDAQTRGRIQAALKRYGIPSTGIPTLHCYTAADFDVATVLRRVGGQCPNPKIDVNAAGAKYQGTCQQQGATANVVGEMQLKGGGTEMASSSRVESAQQGQHYVMESKSVEKWVGADCAHPPEGIDRAWLEDK